MSATTHEAPTAQEPVGPHAEGDRDGGLPAASVPEALGIVLIGVVPALVRGLFTPRRTAMKLLTALDADGRAVSLLSSIRRKYDGQGVRLLKGRLVVLWGANAIRDVLDRSA